MLTIGFIGNGKSTNRYHIPFVLQRENIKIKTIYERSPKNLWDKIEGVNYTTNIEDLLKDDEIQLVVVCTHLSSHYEFAMEVLKNNKNCLVEKPFVRTSKEAKELFAFAKEKGLLIQSYQNRRFDSDFLTVQRVIEEGKLGDLLELEMHYDYFRPEVPESALTCNSPDDTYLYNHGCHTLDQVISYFGKPDNVHYDVRQLLGEGRMNDYFDLDLYYGGLKVSVKSSYFRVKERASFVLYGKKGCFVKHSKDRQEEHLKMFYMPNNSDFGVDTVNHYGVLTFVDENGNIHEEKVKTVNGDYGRVYDDLYEVIVNGKSPTITEEQILFQIEILETGVKDLK